MSNFNTACDEHLAHRERLDNLSGKIDDLKAEMHEGTKYYAKIETALNQLISLQEAIRESTAVNKELFHKVDVLKEELYELKLKIQSHQMYIDSLEENRKANVSLRNQIVGALVVALLGAMGIAYLTVINIKSDIDARAKYQTESVRR